MKKKYIGTVFFSLLLLLLFLPVFFYVIYYGNNVDYNAMHKIVTVEGNRVLFLCAIVGAAVLGILYYFLRKLPTTPRTITVFTAVTVAVCVLFYMINVNISKCIAFYGGWDCGMVANSARWIFEGGELGYDDYYTIYSNNIPITWLLYKLYCFSSGMKAYPYNPEFIWIQFQCVMLSLAVLCSVLLVLRVSKNLGTSVITLIFNIAFLGISPWKIIPYTDGCTIAMPVMILFLYSMVRGRKSRWSYALWFLLMFLGCLSGIMKATCYVAVIAIVIIDIFWTVSEESDVRSRLYGLGGKKLPFVLHHGAGRECIRHYTTNTIRSWKSVGVIICITVSMRTPREPVPERALRSYGLLPVPIRLPGCNMNLQESAGECRTGAL